MRRFFCLLAVCCALCARPLPAPAGSPDADGEWLVYGGNAVLRIEEKSDVVIALNGGEGVRYDVSAKEPFVLRLTRKGSTRPEDERKIVKIHENILLFQAIGRTTILLRKNARPHTPREKIRGRWRRAAQDSDRYYYDAEFDFDAKSVVEFSGATAASARQQGNAEQLKVISETSRELVVQRGESVYSFTRLGKNFLAAQVSGPSAALGSDLFLLRASSPGTNSGKAARAENSGAR